MKKIVIVVLVIMVLVFVAVQYFLQKGPDAKSFDRLLNPVISVLPNQNMLVVEAKGDPTVSGAKAMKLLYKTYYSLKSVPKSFRMNAPRARWPLAFDTPKDQWIGLFALPVPAEIKTLPVIKNPDKQNIYIDKWEYGTVAEILHKGSYNNEQPTIKRLNDYIKQQGYTIIGEHEEDYIKGPGMFGKGNPNKYMTIIRYRVTKKIQTLSK